MVLLLAKNSKAGCLFRSNVLKQVVTEIQKMEHPRQKFSKYPPRRFNWTVSFATLFNSSFLQNEMVDAIP